MREAFIPGNDDTPTEVSEINLFGDPVLKIAAVFEKKEIEMFEAALEVLQNKTAVRVLEDLIVEEKKHFSSITDLGKHDFKLRRKTAEDYHTISKLDESFYCSEEEDCLLRDIYDRESAMADFYLIAADKTNVSAVRNALMLIYAEEKNHAVRIAELLM